MLRKKILVIHKDEEVVDKIFLRLDKNKYEVIPFFDELTALSHYRTNSEEIDLVIFDVESIKIQSSELLSRLKDIKPDVVGVLISDVDDKDTRKVDTKIKQAETKVLTRTRNIRAKIRKPIKTAKLQKTIEELLDV